MDANKKITKNYSNVEDAIGKFYKELLRIEQEGSMKIPPQCFELLTFMLEYNEQIVVLIDNNKEEE